MSQAVKNNKIWIVPICIAIAAGIFFIGWQQLGAQDMHSPGIADPPGMPDAVHDPSSAEPPLSSMDEPPIPIGNVLPSGSRTVRVNNWDGTSTEFLSFKYKTLGGKTITVRLPASYRSDTMTKSAWDTLFQVFGMDVEDQIEAMERDRVPNLAAFREQLMAEIQGEVPFGTFSGESPADAAMDHARGQLPSMHGGHMTLPPMLPSMALF